VAVSPQIAEKSAAVKEKHRLTFPVLSDAGNTYAKSLALAFALPDDLRAVYSAFGIVLPDFNGDDSWELPMPARIVVDREGVIRAIDADPDYTRRPEPAATVEILGTLT
jgi:peroxiredoxin